jgi:hypothetical protein
MQKAAGHEASSADGLSQHSDVCVLADDQRSPAAEAQRRFAGVGGRPPGRTAGRPRRTGEGNPVHCGLVTSPTPALAHPVSWPDSLSRSADSAVCSGGLSVTVKSAAMAPR